MNFQALLRANTPRLVSELCSTAAGTNSPWNWEGHGSPVLALQGAGSHLHCHQQCHPPGTGSITKSLTKQLKCEASLEIRGRKPSTYFLKLGRTRAAMQSWLWAQLLIISDFTSVGKLSQSLIIHQANTLNHLRVHTALLKYLELIPASQGRRG